jgi:hypothetical protein
MYQINYYNDKPVIFNYCFHSLWVAVFKARAITESYGFPTDVLDMSTGAVMVQFEPESRKATYIDSDLPKDVELLALTPLG